MKLIKDCSLSLLLFVQDSGPVPGEPCVFPFTSLSGLRHDRCTKEGEGEGEEGGRHWCAVRVEEGEGEGEAPRMVEGHWGFCSEEECTREYDHT